MSTPTLAKGNDGDSPNGKTSHGKMPNGSRRRKLIPILLVLLGIALMVYTAAVTYVRNVEQSHAADAYRSSIGTDDADYQGMFDAAQKYNEEHAGLPILDPWLARVNKDNRPYQDYLEQLNPSGDPKAVMAALAIPLINVNLPVYHGTDPDTLGKGVGHLYGTALPIGGPGTHSVLTGHTGLTNATLFDHLDDVAEGDRVYLKVLDRKLAYEVDDIRVVKPDQIDSLQPVEGESLLTLITCTPYGVNSHRLLVTGHQVPVDDDEFDDAFNKSGNWQWWMTLVVIICLLALLLLLRRGRRRNREEGAKHRAVPRS